MSSASSDSISDSPSLEAHLLGMIDFEQCLALQQRLAERIGQRHDGQICLLLCEHPEIITVGRGGSPSDVEIHSGLLKSRQLKVRWVKRGGRCLVHTPGQLAVYPIVPLWWHRFTVGEYLERLETAVLGCLRELGLNVHTRPDGHGIWGRTGQLAAFGVSVCDWVTRHGAFINVSPSMGLFRLVETDPEELTRMSCLVAEHRKPVRMATVRADLIRRLAEAFDCDRYHLYTGHPLLRRSRQRQH